MNTKILVLIVIVVGAAGFGFFLFSNNTDIELPESDGITSQVPAPGNEGVDEMIVVGDATNSELTVVTYTDNGFSPKDVTIAHGDRVRFVNESSSGLWPASAPHPTHTVYPQKSDSDCLGSAFDACRSLSNEGFWEFTFNEVGEWGYHNHLRTNKTGTVTVK